MGDGAQRPGRQDVVDALVLQRQVLAIETDVLDGQGTRRESLRRQRASHRGGLHCPYPGDRRRVMRDVAARAEADLEDISLELRRDVLSHLVEIGPAEGHVDEAGQELRTV